MRSHLTLPSRLACFALCLSLLVHTTQLPAAASEGPGGSSKGVARVGAAASGPRREGELLVRFREEAPESERGAVAASKGARRKGKLRGESRVERLELRAGEDAAALAEELSRHPSVELAEPNYLVARDEVTPDDPRFPEQWGLRNGGQAGGAVGADVRATAAWQETTGSRATVIAIVDSGVDFSHPDLANNKWVNASELLGNGKDDDRNGLVDDAQGWDFVTDSGSGGDESGHGTSVAGLIAAEGNNGAGVSGVMWQASLMNLRVLDAAGTGDVASAVEAIDYAARHGAAVINCSWGTEAESLILRDAIERAGRRGVVVVTSAGNSGRDLDSQPYYPAAFDLQNLISVASSDGFDGLAEFSNRGAARVTVAAPGTHLLTTRTGGGYHLASGTSASAALVAGVAGLVKTVRPTLGAAGVRAAVMGGVRQAPALAGHVEAGGVVDAAGALEALRGGSGRGNGTGQGNGQGHGRPYVPPALRNDNEHGRAKGKMGDTAEPPAPVRGTPGPGLPNLDDSRRRRTSEPPAPPPVPIRADLACLDCDPSGGGGGGADFPSDPYFATARTRPANEVGEEGESLGSRNFNWALALVSLPGRAGLDLSLTLHYNSLVWTRQGNSIQYNADHGTPGPGFQLGLPRLQAQHLNADTGTSAYILITSSGGRLEMVQVGSSNVYESRDGSFVQLTFDGSTPVVRTKDGVQLRFGTQVSAEWRCTQIKDRNGNYISAAYNATNGHLLTVTDTLGRVVNFGYNADQNLESISQMRWNGSAHVTHYHAWFVYGTTPMSFSFPGLRVFGATNNSSRPVLSYVSLSTNESFHFDYNSYGQVFRIRRKGPDGHQLAQTTYTFNLSGSLSDCPRFTERRDWAQHWNGDVDGVAATAEEAVTSYSQVNNATWTDPETGVQQTGTLSQMTAPDGVIFKQYGHETGWDAGTPLLSEVWSGGVKRTWTSVKYTQDNTSLSYAHNPRAVEVNVYDEAGKRRRTAIEYSAQSVTFNLPWIVAEYAADASTVLRRTYFDYKWDSAYVSRRIIGLLFRHSVYDGNWNLMSKTEYGYDWDWNGDMFQDTPAPATQHDRTSYGPSFILGRGNLSQVARFDVTDPNNANNTFTETKWRVSSTGSVLMERDHHWHQTFFEYGDSFSDGNNSRNTFAYPTKVTDADGYSSTMQYNFDHGGQTRLRAPSSGTGAGISYVDQATGYDQHGRIERLSRQVNGIELAYKRFHYELNGNYVHAYETIKDLTQANELHMWSIFDGAGRVRATAADHPNSTGGYAGRYFVYDRMGRLAEASNPTEMTGAWAQAGDDAAWYYTLQAYDWQGRPTTTTNPDGSTRVAAYGGCGCAGGEVTTAQDEHGRQRRATRDVFGRLSKVEELNWNGTVYSTTQYAYNARDQITEISQQGQTRTFDYDGHGRLWRRTTPEQGPTTFSYNSDDTVNTMTDARGATVTYGYNGRHLRTSLTYGVAPGRTKTWADAANVSFTYDSAGHRTQMTDGQGSAAYHYDSQGRMDWEERAFTGGSTYRLSYGYNPAGQLTSITYPSQFGSPAPQVTYDYDKAGRVQAVGGANYGGVASYAHTLRYRAFGSLKSMSYPNTRTFSAAYDERLRATTWNVSGVLGYNYSYQYLNEKTGRVTYAQSIYDATLDRSYEYDHVGRLAIAHSGAEARAHVFSGQWGVQDGPFSQGYDYDVWGNMTHRYGWGGDVQGGSPASSTDLHYGYSGNRRTGAGISFDDAGNLIASGGQSFTYDAAGSQINASTTSLNQYYDGDGLRVKKTESGTNPTLYLRSAVLGGQVVAEVSWVAVAWGWTRGHVYLGSQLLAVQQGGVKFVHEDPVTKSKRVTDLSGAVVSAVETDPWGADTNRNSNAAFQSRRFTSYERDGNGGDDAMFRRYSRSQARFDQPDPFDGSYDLVDPQSLNRYAYAQNDPVNFIDPTGLQDYTAPVQEGINVAWAALQRPACNALFGGVDPGKLLEVHVEKNLIGVGHLKDRQTGQPDYNTGARTRVGAAGDLNGDGFAESEITLNLDGAFFTGQFQGLEGDFWDITRIPGTVFHGMSLSNIRGAILIHELLHAAGNPGNFQSDTPAVDPDGSKNRANTQMVIDACFPKARAITVPPLNLPAGRPAIPPTPFFVPPPVIVVIDLPPPPKPKPKAY